MDRCKKRAKRASSQQTPVYQSALLPTPTIACLSSAPTPMPVLTYPHNYEKTTLHNEPRPDLLLQAKVSLSTSTHSPHLLSTLYIPITSSSHAATRQCCVDPGAAQVLVGSVWSGLWKRCLTVGARRERKQQRETTQLSAADITTRQRQCGGCCWFVGLLHSGQVVGEVWWRV